MSGVRVAVAGAGLIGKRHIEEIDASASAELASIVDPGPAGPELAQKYGVALYPSLAELFDKDRPDLDGVADRSRHPVRIGSIGSAITSQSQTATIRSAGAVPTSAERTARRSRRAATTVVVLSARQREECARAQLFVLPSCQSIEFLLGLLRVCVIGEFTNTKEEQSAGSRSAR